MKKSFYLIPLIFILLSCNYPTKPAEEKLIYCSINNTIHDFNEKGNIIYINSLEYTVIDFIVKCSDFTYKLDPIKNYNIFENTEPQFFKLQFKEKGDYTFTITSSELKEPFVCIFKVF